MHVKYSCSHSSGSLRSHFCAIRWSQTTTRFLCFANTGLCSLAITGSRTVPVITFIKFSFWKTNKKKSLFRYVFFLYLKTCTVLKTDEQLFRWHLFSLSNMLICELEGRFSTIWLCFLSLSCHTEISLCIWIEWLRCACFVCVCECAFVRLCTSDWHNGLYCQLN